MPVFQWDRSDVMTVPLALDNHRVTYRAFYFTPLDGTEHDLGPVEPKSRIWRVPDTLSNEQDWVLVMQAWKTGETVTRPDVKVGERCSGKLEPNGCKGPPTSGGLKKQE